MSKQLRRGAKRPEFNEREIRRIEIDLNKVDSLQETVDSLATLSGVVLSDSILALSNTVSDNVTISEGTNALSVGPITIAEGKSVTVEDDAVWTIL